MHIWGTVNIPAPALDLPPVIGHRGAAGIAPENTLAAIRRAHDCGCSWVEFDVRLTADGELVLFHDTRLERTTNGRGKVRKQSYAIIRQLDAGGWFDQKFAGEPVPTFARAIGLLAELGLGANVELKAAPGDAIATAVAAVEVIECHWPAHLPLPLVSSFVPDALAAARDRAPTVPRGLLLGDVAGGDWGIAEALCCVTVNLDHRWLDAATIAEICEAGLSVLAYTVNDPARARELLEWGTVSVISDFPQLLIAQSPAGPLSSKARLPRLPP